MATRYRKGKRSGKRRTGKRRTLRKGGGEGGLLSSTSPTGTMDTGIKLMDVVRSKFGGGTR